MLIAIEILLHQLIFDLCPFTLIRYADTANVCRATWPDVLLIYIMSMFTLNLTITPVSRKDARQVWKRSTQVIVVKARRIHRHRP